jgi:hypothetical protein
VRSEHQQPDHEHDLPMNVKEATSRAYVAATTLERRSISA